jgi:hypothetical protein
VSFRQLLLDVLRQRADRITLDCRARARRSLCSETTQASLFRLSARGMPFFALSKAGSALPTPVRRPACAANSRKVRPPFGPSAGQGQGVQLLECASIVPRHPLTWLGLDLSSISLEFSEIFERVRAI